MLDERADLFDRLAREATGHLRELLRRDTTNPPGHERAAAGYLADRLREVGLTPEIAEAAPDRANVFARLPGAGARRPLLLLSHTDVVPVERDRWTVDPFAGEERDGFIYGRGAVDMKQMTAIELTLIRHFAQTGAPLARDLLFLAVADEETGGELGMRWVIDHHPAWVDAEFALNEGGGQQIELPGVRAYVCEVAQKGNARVTLRASGAPGHASIPHRHSAILALARALDRVGSAPLPVRVIGASREFILALAATQAEPARTGLLALTNPDHADAALARLPETLADALSALLRDTVSPTILNAGQSLNVIPSEATAWLDCRTLPGTTPEALAAALRARIGDLPVTVAVEPNSAGYEGTSATDLFAAITAAVARHDPGAVVLPYLFPAVSDSRFLPARGVIPHGFIPHRAEPGVPPLQALAHGHDERVSLANIAFGVRVLFDTIRGVCD